MRRGHLVSQHLLYRVRGACAFRSIQGTLQHASLQGRFHAFFRSKSPKSYSSGPALAIGALTAAGLESVAALGEDFNITFAPTATVWSGPALAIGARLPITCVALI